MMVVSLIAVGSAVSKLAAQMGHFNTFYVAYEKQIKR